MRCLLVIAALIGVALVRGRDALATPVGSGINKLHAMGVAVQCNIGLEGAISEEKSGKGRSPVRALQQ
jgi:hypothetical protein